MAKNKLTKYDIAISFTEKDASIAEKVAKALRKKGFSVYFYKKINQWSKDLNSETKIVYGRRSNYGVVILSTEYKRKKWTMKEWKLLQEAKKRRRIKEIFIIKVDGHPHLPGLKRSTIYHRWSDDASEVAKKIRERVDYPPERTFRIVLAIMILVLLVVGLFYAYTLSPF